MYFPSRLRSHVTIKVSASQDDPMTLKMHFTDKNVHSAGSWTYR